MAAVTPLSVAVGANKLTEQNKRRRHMTRYRFSAVGNGDTWDTGLGSTGASIVEFLIGPSTGYGPTAPVCVSDYTSGVVTFSTDGSSASFDLLVIHTL